MDIDLEKMSRDELLTLQKDVERALSTLEERKRAEARAAVEKAAREHGFSVDEILASTPKKAAAQKNPPKYRNPEDPRQTWSGRGRKPDWIKNALENGKSLEDMAI